MLANDIQEGLIRKPLLVIANRRRGIYARENCCLARSTLWSAANAERRISRNYNSVKRNNRNFMLKDSEWLRPIESIERVVWPAPPNAQSVNKEEKNRLCICHSHSKVVNHKDTKSTKFIN